MVRQTMEKKPKISSIKSKRKPTIGGKKKTISKRKSKTRGPKISSAAKSRKHQMRSTFASIVNTMTEARMHIKEEHKELWKKTPFYLLFKSIYDNKLTNSICTKYDANTISIIKQFKPKVGKLDIWGELIQLHKSDVKLIFGILDGNKHMTPATKGGKRNSEFVKRVFPRDKQLTMKCLKDTFKALLKSYPDSIEDSVRVLCLMILASVFLPTTGRVIHWGYVEYVEDLEKIKDYDWCGLILEILTNSMVKKHEAPSRVNGCTIFLLYWLCEHTRISRPIDGPNIPRCVKWNLQDLWNKVDQKTLGDLRKKEVIVRELQATLKEAETFDRLVRNIEPFVDVEKHKEIKGADDVMFDENEAIGDSIGKQAGQKDDVAAKELSEALLGLKGDSMLSREFGTEDGEGQKEEGRGSNDKNDQLHEVVVEDASIDGPRRVEDDDNDGEYQMPIDAEPLRVYSVDVAPTTIEYKGQNYTIEQLVRKLDNLEDKIRTMEDERFTIGGDNCAMKLEVNQLKSNVVSLTRQLSEVNRVIEKQNGDILNLQESNAELRQLNDELVFQINTLNKKDH